MIFAARLMQDASPTEVPPNFITCNRLVISSFASADKFTPTVVDALLSLPPLQTLYRRGRLPSADMATFLVREGRADDQILRLQGFELRFGHSNQPG